MPNHRRPSQRREAPPPGTPFRHPASKPRCLATAHAVGLVLGPHARTGRAQKTRAAGRERAPDARRPLERGEVQPCAHTRTSTPTASWQRTPTVCPKDRQLGEDERLTPDAPHEGAEQPPRARSSRTREHGQRAPAPPETANPRNVRPTGLPLPGTPSCHPREAHRPAGHAGRTGQNPHSRTRPHSTWAVDPGYPPPGRAAKRGRAPDPRRASQRPRGNHTPPLWRATPGRARVPGGWAPASAHQHPQQVGSGPRPPT